MSQTNRIGIIMNRVYRETNQKILQGILKQAYSLGYSAAVFSTQEENQDTDGHYGENNLFHLINFDLFDGFIFLPSTFILPETIQRIIGFLNEKCDKPILCMGEDYPQFPSIWQDDYSEFVEIMHHLVHEHNRKKIICLTGPKHTQAALAREAAYRDVMAEAGLIVGPQDVIYGDFWQPSAVALGNEIADGVRPMPEAVACANDAMAMHLCDTLAQRGIRVPEDLLVIGYDGTIQGHYHKPGICSYRTSWTMLGVRAMCALYALMFPGQTCKECMNERGQLLKNRSCGCIPDGNPFTKDALIDDHVMEQRYLDNNMSNQLLCTKNLAEFAKIALDWVYYVFSPDYYEKETFAICLCSDWDKVGEDGLAIGYRTDRYSKRIFSLFDTENQEYFSSAEMFPPNHLKEGVPSVSFFAPIHFQKHCFGYAILTLNNIADGYNLHFPRYCKDISNGLECLCIRNRLKSMTYRAFLSETRDTLTGVYQMSTFPKFWKELTEKSILYGESPHACLISVSGLQQINEQYGQVEGDQVLMQIAAILMGCCQNGEVCIRSAGNKFLLLGSRSEHGEQLLPMADMISDRIERYNQTSGKPYRVQVYTVLAIESAQSPVDSETLYKKMELLLEQKKNSNHSRAEHLYYAAFAKLRRDIYQYPEEDWSVARCSGITEMSASHFQRIYRAVFGISCMRDVQNSKLCFAKNLLLHTSDTLQSIAERCGYDYSHFMRLFKKEVGMTPTEYRSGVHLQKNDLI